jgi:translation initiation factor 1 (eIF-1/SUI1)
MCKKKLACGAAPVEKEDGSIVLEIQGNVKDKIFELITETYKVPVNLIYTYEDKKHTKRCLLKDELL